MVGVTFQALLGRAASGSTASLAYVSTATSSAAGPGVSYASQAVGAQASDRVIVVCCEGIASGATSDISGVTVGGNAATLIAKTNSATGGFGTASGIYAILDSSANTALTIVVTFAGSQVRGAISVYNLTSTGGVTTPFHTNTALGTTPISTTLNTTAGGAALGFSAFSSAGTTTWTGLGTKDVDSNVGGAPLQYSGAHTNATSAATGASIQASATGSNNLLVLASW